MAFARPGAGTVAAGDSRHRDSQPRGTGPPGPSRRLAGAGKELAKRGTIHKIAAGARITSRRSWPSPKVSDPPMQGALDFTGPTAITVRHFAGRVLQESFRR